MACLRWSSRRVGTVLALPTSLLSAACGDSTSPRAIPAVTITIDPAQATLAIGAITTLTATVRDAEGRALTGRTITWVSGAPTVASVSASGVVQALDAGIATITAVSDPGLGLARVVVQEDVRLPLPGERHWLLLTSGELSPQDARRMTEGSVTRAGGTAPTVASRATAWTLPR